MKESKARARRAIHRAQQMDFTGVQDPRPRGRYEHWGLLRLLVIGLASAKRALRGVESVGDDLPRETLRALGLKKAPSDTLLYRLLETQSLAGFAQVLVRQVKAALLHKHIDNDLFDEGVVAIDGKKAWSGIFAADPSCHEQTENGRTYHVLMAQRASLVSSSARPCVTQRIIAKHAGEADTFKETFGFLMKFFRRSFEIITHDAGGVSRENAQLVNAANKAYVFAIKGNQPRVHLVARGRLGSKEAHDDATRAGEAFTQERADGALMRREIWRCSVDASDPEIEFAGARALWRVRQTATRTLPSGRIEDTVEDRYFITNRVFSAQKALTLVRLHWGIENGPNWTADVVLGEDAGSPCRNGRGVAVTSWLRLIAYNLVSMWRRKLPPRRDERVATWTRACASLAQALGVGLLDFATLA